MGSVQGQCTCGAVKFSFEAEAIIAYQCHCSICRKVSGSAYTTTTMVPARDFVWREGEALVSTYRKQNGFTTGFCSHCGCSLPNRFRDYPLYSVPLGALDQSPEVTIAVQLFVASKAAWEVEPLTGERYPEMPSLDEMLDHLGHPERD